jgi:hypothetical protein
MAKLICEFLQLVFAKTPEKEECTFLWVVRRRIYVPVGSKEKNVLPVGSKEKMYFPVGSKEKNVRSCG